MGWLAGGPAKMAATNKCLARSNKSRTGAEATNKRPAARRNFLGTANWRDPVGGSAVPVFAALWRREPLAVDIWFSRPMVGCSDRSWPASRPPWPTGRRPSRRKNSPSNESSPNQTYRRNDVSEIHHRFHCRGCNRLCCVRAPALIDFRRGLRVRLLQLAADILGGFLSAHDHRHLDRNARMAARIWQANRGVMARGSGSGAV